jgi:hypothetical protein
LYLICKNCINQHPRRLDREPRSDAYRWVRGIASALDLLEARAQLPSGRSACVSLSMPAGCAVAIAPDGWRVLGCPPVRFQRSPGMLPLPTPERGGSIEILRPFLNLSNQNDFILIVA